MKKFTILAVLAALTFTASAATISWGFGGKVYVSQDGTSGVLSTEYTGTAPAWSLALVYVGQDQSSFDIADLTAASVVDTMSYAIQTSGKASNIGKWDPSTKNTITSAYENNASFAVVLYDSDAGTFDYVYSGSTSVGDAFTSATKVTDMSGQGSASLLATGSGTVSGIVKAAPVPEPATGALALAGIALLFKRRKA